MIGKPLTKTEELLFAYLESERQAILFAREVTLPEHATYEQVEAAVCFVLCKVKEQLHGRIEVKYLGGRRCDHWRKQ
jgi:hypothetical protein